MAKAKNKEEIDATAIAAPTHPGKEIVEQIIPKIEDARLVYHAGYVKNYVTDLKEKAVQIKCSECGEEWYSTYSYAAGEGESCLFYGAKDPFGFIDVLDGRMKGSGSDCICPECGAHAEAMHIGKISKYGTEIGKHWFATTHTVRGHFVFLTWYLSKMIDKDARIWYEVNKAEGMAIIDGKPVRLCGQSEFMYSVWQNNKWEPRVRWKTKLGHWDEKDVFIDKKALYASDADKSALDVYFDKKKTDVNVAAYMQLWAKYPQIENLVRGGFTRYVSDLISDNTFVTGYYGGSYEFSIKEAAKHINTKAVKPHEILGLSKDDLPLAKRFGVDEIDFYKRILKEKGLRLTTKELERVKKIGTKKLSALFDKTAELGIKAAPVRVINYIVRQRKDHRTSLPDPDYLIDYWNMLVVIHGSVPAELAFPKNLVTAHDIAVERKKDIVDRRTNKCISEHAKTLEALSWEDPETGLMIRPARSQKELINEGKVLHHCVGSYAKAVAERRTSIFFIRKIADPDAPFFTLEWKNRTVNQNRGMNNRSRTPEVERFEAKWLKHIKEINYGKRTTESTAAEHAVA